MHPFWHEWICISLMYGKAWRETRLMNWQVISQKWCCLLELGRRWLSRPTWELWQTWVYPSWKTLVCFELMNLLLPNPWQVSVGRCYHCQPSCHCHQSWDHHASSLLSIKLLQVVIVQIWKWSHQSQPQENWCQITSSIWNHDLDDQKNLRFCTTNKCMSFPFPHWQHDWW